MTHRILTDDPDLRALAQALGQLDVAEQVDAARRQTVWDSNARAQAEHADTAGRALLAGKEPPPAPVLAVPAGDPGVFTRRRAELRQAERDVLAEHSGRLLAALDDREQTLTRQAREWAAKGQPIVTELQDVVAAVAAITQQTGGQAPVWRWETSARGLAQIAAEGRAPTQAGSGRAPGMIGQHTVGQP